MAWPSTIGRPSAPRSARRLHPFYGILAVALFAAALGYVLHHLPPLRAHPVQGVVVGLALAAAIAVGTGRLAAGRRRYELPSILVAPPAGPDLRALSRTDLDFCVALHEQALPHGFFVELGRGFLRAYYATFLDSPHAVAFTATVSEQPVGYIVGVVQPRAHARWLLRRRGPMLALYGALGLALHPKAGYRFGRTRLGRYARAWRRHRRGSDRPVVMSDAPAVLTHVAILPGGRGLAAGRRLVEAFEAAAHDRRVRRAVLTTLAGGGGAGAFYARLGWTRSAMRRTPDGVPMEEWTRVLDGRMEG